MLGSTASVVLLKARMLLVVGAGGLATTSAAYILPIAAGGAPFFTREWRGVPQRQEACFLLISFVETLLINVVILGNLRNLRFYFNRLLKLLLIFELWR